MKDGKYGQPLFASAANFPSAQFAQEYRCYRGIASKGEDMYIGRPEREARKRVLAAMGSWTGGPLHVRRISELTGFPDTPSLRSALSNLATEDQIEHVGLCFYLPRQDGQESR